MTQDFTKFQSLKPKLLDNVDDMLANDIARLMVMVWQEESQMTTQVVKGGTFEGTMNGPFGHGYGEGAGEGIDDLEWVVAKDKPTYDEIFYTLSPVNGKITGASAKKEMVRSKLPNTVLGKIWKLADVDHDGLLDDEEFALANHLIKVKLEGHELPAELPSHLVPPSNVKGNKHCSAFTFSSPTVFHTYLLERFPPQRTQALGGGSLGLEYNLTQL